MPALPEPGFAPPDGLRWLYVDFNSYFASVEQQLNPALRGRPVAVIPVETDSTCAIAASYEAKALGVKTGTPIYEARKMCPELICVLARHEHYTAFHHRLIEEIGRHIPVSAVCSIDEMACHLMKNEQTPERGKTIALAIKEGIARNVGAYVRCSIGLAPSKYLAKVATDLQKPDGLTVLMPGDLPERLYALALRDLPGIGRNMERRLNRAGIYDLRTLMGLPPKHLRAVWGSLWGERMWYYLRGYDLPDPETDRRSIGHSHVLAPEMRPPEQAHIIARRLTMKAAARLRRIGFYAERFSLSVQIENGPRLSSEACCTPARDSFLFLGLLEQLWQAMVRDSGGRRIKKIGVVLHGLVPEGDVHIQPDLFALPAATAATTRRREEISQAIDRLNRKFGRDTILFGMTGGQEKFATSTKIAFTRIPDIEEFLE
jgi:Nucleotidyltransferase/DNA polymerase involved in DNA repair